jgi:hypothetical protein
MLYCFRLFVVYSYDAILASSGEQRSFGIVVHREDIVISLFELENLLAAFG